MWSLVLGALAVTAAAVRTFGKSKASTSDSSTKDVSEVGDKSLAKAQSSLKLRFLVVMLVVRFSDWLQGPYFYDLYSVKIDSRTGQQFTPGAVSTLFLVGFCSGMLFGTLAGSLSDTFGRKAGCIFCLAIFATETLLVESSQYEVLFLGRVLAGLASSMLHTVFESWLNSEAKRLRVSDAWLSDVFGWQWFGDGIVAVIAGVVAEALHATSAGPVAVFRFSAGCLIAALLLTVSLWNEHTPSAPAGKQAPAVATPTTPSSSSNIRAALQACFSDPRILLLAGIQCLFEGSMYTFVLAWVPTLRAAASLDPSGFTLPFGVIFACFMVCIMIGSGLYSSLPQPVHISASKALVVSMFGGAAAFGLTSSLPASPRLVSVGFLAFEVFCGLYFPCTATLRSTVVPSRLGSTVRALSRIPLNLFVIVVLMNFEAWGVAQVMFACAIALGVAGFLQLRLTSVLTAAASKASSP